MIGGTIGVRYARNCHPDELWTSYFTSSKSVKDYREMYGEPEVIEIRQVFDDPLKARDWELTVLRRLGAVKDEKWLNRGIGGKGGHFLGKKFNDYEKKRLSSSKRLFYAQKRGFEDIEEITRYVLYALDDGLTPDKIRKDTGLQGVCFDNIIKSVDADFLKKNFKRAYRGIPKSEKHKKNISKGRKGITISAEAIEKRKETLRISGKGFGTKKAFLDRIKAVTEKDFLDSIRELKNIGWSVLKIARKFSVDYNTIKMRYQTL